jgi:4'-phosphopantetheinyl transferase EntD
MRKTPTKLALRKEALRALSTINLARVGGHGDGAPLAGDLTHETVCPAALAGDLTHENGCPAAVALKP